MKEFPKLKNPPIAEVIVDWNGVLPASWKLENQKEKLQEEFQTIFPHYQGKTIQEANVHFPMAGEPELTTPHPKSLFAHQFWNEKRTRLLQYRKNGFSFNMLPPYTTFEDEIPSMQKEWERFLSLVPVFELREIRLRFINRIRIPIMEEFLDWDAYFTIGKDSLCVPEGFKNFMKSNYSAWQDHEKSQAIARTIFLENLLPKEIAQIIFDTECIQANLTQADALWEKVGTVLNELRDLKNQVFFQGITEQCLQIFQ